MLEQLHISDLGVISDTELELGPGLNVLTGETGAGKTMVVTALGLIMGQRAEARLVREGQAKAKVQGTFSTAPTVDPALGLDPDLLDDTDGWSVLRQVSNAGKSRAAINGTMVSATVLQAVASDQIVIHGQSDQLRLRSATWQLRSLDAYGGADHAAVYAKYRESYAQYRKLLATNAELVKGAAEREQEAATLREQLALIEQLSLGDDEGPKLRALVSRGQNLSQITEHLQASTAALEVQNDLTISDNLATAASALAAAAGLDDSLAQLSQRASGLQYEVEDLSAGISQALQDALSSGMDDIEQAAARLSEIQRVERILGAMPDTLPERLATGSDRLLELDQQAARFETIATEISDAQNRVTQAAQALTKSRTALAKQLQQAVSGELAKLAMGSAQFVIEISEAELSPTGADEVQFMLQARPGSTPQPITKAASGGELSRIMLALEVVLASNDAPKTMVFDEVDSGVGGASAVEIGRRLHQLSVHTQVLVVTHLPQVAAFADRHIVVKKHDDGSDVISSVDEVTDSARTEELARMLSGSVTELSLAHAAELIAESAATAS